MIAMQIFLTTTAASEGIDVLRGSYKYKHGENALWAIGRSGRPPNKILAVIGPHLMYQGSK